MVNPPPPAVPPEFEDLEPPHAVWNNITAQTRPSASMPISFDFDRRRSEPMKQNPPRPKPKVDNSATPRLLNIAIRGYVEVAETVSIELTAVLPAMTDGGENRHDVCAGRFVQLNATELANPPVPVTLLCTVDDPPRASAIDVCAAPRLKSAVPAATAAERLPNSRCVS